MTDTTKAMEAAIEAGARASFDFSNGFGEFDKLDADGGARAWIMQTTRTAVLTAMSTLRPAIRLEALEEVLAELQAMQPVGDTDMAYAIRSALEGAEHRIRSLIDAKEKPDG